MLFNGYCTGQASSVNPVLAPPTVQWPYPCLTNSSGGPASGGVDACVGETLTMSVGDPGWQFSDANDAWCRRRARRSRRRTVPTITGPLLQSLQNGETGHYCIFYHIDGK